MCWGCIQDSIVCSYTTPQVVDRLGEERGTGLANS